MGSSAAVSLAGSFISDGDGEEGSGAAQRTFDSFDFFVDEEKPWVSAAAGLCSGSDKQRPGMSGGFPISESTQVQAISFTGSLVSECEICKEGIANSESTVVILPGGKRAFARTRLKTQEAKQCHKKCLYHWNLHPEKCKPCADWHNKGKCRKEFSCHFCHLPHTRQMMGR